MKDRNSSARGFRVACVERLREIFERPQRVAIRTWVDCLERDVLARLQKTARSRVLAGPLVVLPDVHAAGDVCVGTVLVTSGVVFPAAVGVDLGCGMASQAYPLTTDDFSRRDREEILSSLQDAIPTGQRAHGRPMAMDPELGRHDMSCSSAKHIRDWLAPRHLGTLGGGNHFLELQRATNGQLWVTVHSGSRGPGASIAGHHARIAKSGEGQKDASGLWYLEWESTAGQAFRQDLDWALRFAVANRKMILEHVNVVLNRYVGHALTPTESIDVAHNSILLESHQGKPVVVHRKGASPASKGMRGILPGSMGTATYIVEGLGNTASFHSCAHGSGRRMTRTEARRRIQVRQLRREMERVVYPRDAGLERALVEEAPSAYKDIKSVLREQSDLIRPVQRLEPVAVLKGV